MPETPDHAALARLAQPDVMARWTAERQQEHEDDARAYAAALAAIQSMLRQQHVEGDGRMAARRRARRVERPLRRLKRAAEQQAAAAEALRTAYAEHVREVQAAPQRRAERTARRERRAVAGAELRGALGSAAQQRDATAAPTSLDDALRKGA